MTELRERLKKIRTGIGASYIALAVLMLIVIDCLFRLGFCMNQGGLSNVAFDVPYRSRTWWAIKDYACQPKIPDVLLLGASDMTCALYGAEATFSNTAQSQILNHHSRYLEQLLALRKSQLRSSFCMGIPGQMPSDSYFLASVLVNENLAPKVIVCSIAPRSLCDATFGDPSTTDTYKLMNKLGSDSDFRRLRRESVWEEIDDRLKQISCIYAHKWELLSSQHHLVQSMLTASLGQEFNTASTPLQIRKIALLELPEDYAPSELLEYPFDPKNAHFISNLMEYRARYRKLEQRTFVQQLEYLRKLGELCRSNGIRYVVINSPLTDENRQMVPKKVFDLYLAAATGAVQATGGTFVDLDSSKLFKHSDFSDTIHLNGLGGEKYLDAIAQVISTSSQMAATSAAPSN